MSGVDQEFLRNLKEKVNIVEVAESCYGDSVAQLESLRKKIQASIVNIVGIRVEVKIVQPNRIPRSEGKAKRVLDKRNI